ncbi:ArnT family glycosyltransferase [Chitinophaga japonensis]|uniref:Dolichyl-phosphate-mannose-protein mannosyltransferase n=1 Tax=Chitinophaga japonensis TaxID=104662 RepID=A0A562T0R0_CHIJA|nr:glycosyltransferase family 39 protein [Chitinophaga japonensis]TWI86923.1 dolichyl-phosphate-mannose-protein mannosyltransferase [Chitinophaga japonensis]
MHNSYIYQLEKSLYDGYLIPVIYFVLMTVVAFQDHVFADWDASMHYFSGLDIYRGNGYRGWASHFWPPLFPVLTGLLAKLAPAVEFIKLISVISASLLLLLVYTFVYKLSESRTAAWLAQLPLVTNTLFIQLSVQVENHMLDSLFYILSILLLIKSLEGGNGYRYLFVGIVCGLAGLTRYTSYSLLPAFVLTVFFFYPFRRAVSYATCLMLGFTLMSSPWWIVNYFDNGSPFATWQYMNIGIGVFSVAHNKWVWCWDGINGFNSGVDIFLYAPGAYIVNFLRNILKSLVWIIYRGQTVGLLCLIAGGFLIYNNYYKRERSLLRSKIFVPVLICFGCYLLLVSQAFVFSEVFLSWLVLIVVYGTFAIYKQRSMFIRIKPVYKRCAMATIVLGIGIDIANGSRQLSYYFNQDHGMEENTQVADLLKSIDNNIRERVIMCFHPARAYYLGCKYVTLPLYYRGGLSGLISFKNMSEKVKTQAARFPSTISNDDLKADYLIYDVRATICLPQFSFLLQRGSPRIPENFRLVYLSDKVAVYRIN